MSRRGKLREKMATSPSSIRFAEVESLLRYEGFILFTLVVAIEAITGSMVVC